MFRYLPQVASTSCGTGNTEIQGDSSTPNCPTTSKRDASIQISLLRLIMTASGRSHRPYKNINVVPRALTRFRAFNQSRPYSGISKKGKISGVLLALAASLALGATTVAAKDNDGGGGGGRESHQGGGGGGGGEKMRHDGDGGGGEKMRHEGRDGGGGERMRRHEEHGFGFTMTDMVVAAIAIAGVVNAPIAGAGAVRVSVAASGATAAKKSVVSDLQRRLLERWPPFVSRS